MASPRRSRKGHAEVPGSFRRWTDADVESYECEPGQYEFANYFGRGCTYAKLDNRQWGCGGHVVWGTPNRAGAQCAPGLVGSGAVPRGYYAGRNVAARAADGALYNAGRFSGSRARRARRTRSRSPYYGHGL